MFLFVGILIREIRASVVSSPNDQHAEPV